MAEEEPVINHMLSPNEMLNKALILRGYTARRLRRVKPKTNVYRFKHHFGVSPCTAARVYSDLQSTADEDYKMEGGERDLKYLLLISSTSSLLAFECCHFILGSLKPSTLSSPGPPKSNLWSPSFSTFTYR